MKTCTKCGENKQQTEFHKSDRNKDGLATHCKSCRREASAKWYASNKEMASARNARWRENNKQHIAAHAALYYASNKEAILAAHAKWKAENQHKVANANAYWRANNKQKLASNAAAWAAANQERARSNQLRWLAENPGKPAMYYNSRRARKAACGGRISPGIAPKLYKLQHGKCACCGQPLGDDYHLDHIMPLALGGSNTDDNIQLLRAKCNLQKSAKHPIDFMQSRGLLL